MQRSRTYGGKKKIGKVKTLLSKYSTVPGKQPILEPEIIYKFLIFRERENNTQLANTCSKPSSEHGIKKIFRHDLIDKKIRMS